MAFQNSLFRSLKILYLEESGGGGGGGGGGASPRKFWISWSSDKLFPAFWGVFQQEINLINRDTLLQFYSLPSVIQSQ
jgi:hypothetical protein